MVGTPSPGAATPSADSGERAAKARKLASLADIMSPEEDDTLRSFTAFTPLQRIALSANGNLQRIVSSYYNAPVTVHVVHTRRVSAGKYEREVTLSVNAVEFCRATSRIELEREEYIEAREMCAAGCGLTRSHHRVARVGRAAAI